jgi:DNA-binding response OmpR family regulator
VSTGKTVKVLLIDGNVFFAKRLIDALTALGMEVIHATQAGYAMTMIEWNPPTVIVCATNLREMGAFEILAVMHADEKASQIPVIALGDGGEQALMAAFRAGCADFVERRIGPEKIAAHVRAFLRSQRDGFQPTQMLTVDETALSGNLAHLDLPGVVQMLEQQRQSGALHVISNELDGILFFAAGDISHAECGELIGDDAVIAIVQRCQDVVSGEYKFVPGAESTTRTVMRSPTQLMLDALRVLDEANAEHEVNP